MNAGFLIILVAYAVMFIAIGVAIRHVLESINSHSSEKPSRRI